MTESFPGRSFRPFFINQLINYTMVKSKGLIRPFKACCTVCQHHDQYVRLLINDSRTIDEPGLDTINACNSICVVCHYYIE